MDVTLKVKAFSEVTIDEIDLAAFVKKDSNRCVFEDRGCDIKRGVGEERRRGNDCGVSCDNEGACIMSMPSTWRRRMVVLGY